jgi:hypothetical protein
LVTGFVMGESGLVTGLVGLMTVRVTAAGAFPGTSGRASERVLTTEAAALATKIGSSATAMPIAGEIRVEKRSPCQAMSKGYPRFSPGLGGSPLTRAGYMNGHLAQRQCQSGRALQAAQRGSRNYVTLHTRPPKSAL